ncbi:hypothetical protein GCM10011491_07540 [Brucella endophytica]|uniref:DUF4153 domain-containing protein n=1 Tax=Brucella endophytica TaxID=1963359 RepID=A0A916S4M9_9HYPH|nr:DUF4153 domain-containing protein [Brucella endophytica]GGA82617.1 hypothetical protein GCM10011491_07540 [Brucella endophytica]
MSTSEELNSDNAGWRYIIGEMFGGLQAALLRFPVPALFLVVGTVQAALMIAEFGFLDFGTTPGRLLLGVEGGALSALAACLFGESRQFSAVLRSALALLAGFAIAALLAFPHTFLSTEMALFWGVGGSVLIAPFIRRGTSGAFCLFSARVALAALLGVLLLLLFAGGISAILGSVGLLFGIKLPGDLYRYVWALTGLLVAPLFTMGQFPRRFDDEPSKVALGFMDLGMRTLGDLVIAPLLAVYALIIHLYALKILVTGEMPKGQIGFLVLVYGVCIFVALLVVSPFCDRARAPTRLLLRFWPFFLPVPLALLFYALVLRIADYGVTPARYLLGLSGLVIALILLIQLSPRLRGDSRVIAGLPVLALILGSFGPQGALGVSLASQTDRFLAIVKNPPVDEKRFEEAMSALFFLDKHKALERVAKEGADASSDAAKTAAAWGLVPKQDDDEPGHFGFSSGDGAFAFATSGFDTVVQNVRLPYPDRPVSVSLPAGRSLVFSLEPHALIVALGDQSTRFPITPADIDAMAGIKDGDKPTPIHLEGRGKQLVFLPSFFRGFTGETGQLQSLGGTVLLRAEDWR